MDKKQLDSYFAGLIDGEGYVGINSQKYQNSVRPVIKVDMTCEETILALQKHFGGWISKKQVVEGHKPQWRWEVNALKARSVAAAIFPYSITKKGKIKAIIDLPVTKQGRPLSKATK